MTAPELNTNNLMNAIRSIATEYGARLFRNNVGRLQDRKGKYVNFGVCNPGGSDLIGWRPVTITQNMVGRKVAQFFAVEVKTGRDKLTQQQKAFGDKVTLDGGLFIEARSVEDVLGKITNEVNDE